MCLISFERSPSIHTSCSVSTLFSSYFILTAVLNSMLLHKKSPTSKNVFPCFTSSHSPWTNCLCYPLTFLYDFYLLYTFLYQVQCCCSSAPLFSQLFMWERPGLLKPEAMTKTRANDQDCCQSNTQACQRCKQMCACTKGRSRSLFTASTLRTQYPFTQKHNMHMQTPDFFLYLKERSLLSINLGS